MILESRFLVDIEKIQFVNASSSDLYSLSLRDAIAARWRAHGSKA
jgi:hypothetical protein